MNKRCVLLICLLAVTSAAVVQAVSEFRSPLGRFGDIWLDFRYLGNATDEDEWAAIVQGAVITRSGSTTFAQFCPVTCKDNKTTSKTGPLSAIFFNEANFEGQQVFYGGNLNGRDSDEPSLVSTVLSPRVTYEEWCVSIGLHAYRDLKTEKRWRLGGRIGLPIKSIRIQNDNTCCTSLVPGSSNGGSSVTSNNVIDCRQEFNQSNGATPSTVCSYRLDYLASLLMPNGQPLVVFGDGTSANPTMIAGRVVDDSFFTVYGLSTNTTGGYSNTPDCQTNNGAGAAAPNAPVYLMRQSTGAMPFDPIFNPTSENGINGNYILTADCSLGTLPANGSVGADGDRYRFGNGTNYAASLANNPAEQAKWFVIPVASANSYKTPELTYEIFNIIEYVVNNNDSVFNISEDSALQFFANNGVFLSQSQNIVGAGDLEVEIYGGRYWEKSYINGYFGFRLPTGKEMDDVGEVYFQSPGHNGHFELMVAVDGGVQFNNIIAFQGDAGYHAVLRHTERRAAPFQGATIRNIGPTIDADVSWGWFQLNAGFTLFHPQDPDLGCTFGYEFYAKQKDSVRLCATTATDLLGGTYPLCAELLEANTNTQTNKIRATCFYKIGYAEFIGGAYYVFAGKHAMKEVGWHVGLNISF